MTEPFVFEVTDGQVIEVADLGEVVPVELGGFHETSGVQIPGSVGTVGGALKLDDLNDVEGALQGSPGQVLTKDDDGQWRPADPTGGSGGGGGSDGPFSHLHTQDTPSTVWIITHGLPFDPSGIEVYDNVGSKHYPTVTWPNGTSVRLDFNFNVRGTARLS